MTQQTTQTAAARRLVAAFTVALALGFLGGVASCSSSSDLCQSKNVKCSGGLVCDPSDGICKCGGRGGVVCSDGWACDPVSNTCQSNKCEGDGGKVDCSAQVGTSCDVIDGTCKCGGTGGKVCAANELCDPNAKDCIPAVDCTQVACPRNQVCDQTTGHCQCGAKECAANEACSLDSNNMLTCTTSLCAGVQCSGATACDPADGYCKCAGQVCQSGEACACPAGFDGGTDGGTCDPTARACTPGGACNANTVCDGGTTCDPADGFCKCGGPGGPRCSPDQVCSLIPAPQCQGGAQCTLLDGGAKQCSGGSSCDPEDGICKCGGRGGSICAAATDTDPAEVCIQIPNGQESCKRPCDVRSPVCPTAQYCFFDSSLISPTAYCAVPTDYRDGGSACSHATDCFQTDPLPTAGDCSGLVFGQPGICRSYCDTSVGNSGCIQVPRPQLRNQITAAPTGYGYCQPQ